MKLKDWLTPHSLITLLAIFVVIISYKYTVDAMAENVKVNTAKIAIIEKDTIILKTEVPKLQEDIKEVKDAVTIIQSDIKLVLWNLNKMNNK